MPVERVQVLPQHLPRPFAGDLPPLFRRQRQIGQHLERHIRHFCRGTGPEGQPILHHLWQRRGICRFADQPGIKRRPRRGFRFGVNHTDHIRQRRIIANACRQQRPIARRVQPSLHHRLGPRAQRLAPGLPRPHDLHKGPQHPPAVHHAVEHQRKQRRIAPRQHRQQEGWRVFHMALGAHMQGGFGQKRWLDRLCQFQQAAHLRLCVLVKRIAKRPGHRQLRQGMRVGVSVGFCPGKIAGGCLRQQPPQGCCKHGFVCHHRYPFVFVSIFCPMPSQKKSVSGKIA